MENTIVGCKWPSSDSYQKMVLSSEILIMALLLHICLGGAQ